MRICSRNGSNPLSRRGSPSRTRSSCPVHRGILRFHGLHVAGRLPLPPAGETGRRGIVFRRGSSSSRAGASSPFPSSRTISPPRGAPQEERRHTLVDTGIYALVRHPMYAGIILLLIGIPLLLQSYAGVVFGVVPGGPARPAHPVRGRFPEARTPRLRSLYP